MNPTNSNNQQHHSSMMAHEAEMIIPGSFVVLQGSTGDGIANTMNFLPEYYPEYDDDDCDDDLDNHDDERKQEHLKVKEKVLDIEEEEEASFTHVPPECLQQQEDEYNQKPKGMEKAHVKKLGRKSTSTAAATLGQQLAAKTSIGALNGLTITTTTTTAKLQPRISGSKNNKLPYAASLLQNTTMTTASQVAAAAVTANSSSDYDDSSFIVVSEENTSTNNTHSSSSSSSSSPAQSSPCNDSKRAVVVAAVAAAAAPNPTNNTNANTTNKTKSRRRQQKRQDEILKAWKQECKESGWRKRQEWKEAAILMCAASTTSTTATVSATEPMDHVLIQPNTITNNTTTTTVSEIYYHTTNNNYYSSSSAANNNNNNNNKDEWWLQDGKVAILRDIPTRLKSNGTVLRSVLGTLNPGFTVVATDIIYLHSKTLERIAVHPLDGSDGGTTLHDTHKIYPNARLGWIVLIKLAMDSSFSNTSTSTATTNTTTSSCTSRGGYVVLSLDGYPLLNPGLPSLYVDPQVWIWRVTCPAGAFVREGLDLNSQHLDTLPYGSLVRVTQRTLNNQGLSRLRVTAILEEPDDITNTNNGNHLPENNNNNHGKLSLSRFRRMNNNSNNNNNNGGGNNHNHRQRHHHSPMSFSSMSSSSPSSSSSSRRRLVDGWCSEFLNPLSGNRGTVLEPLSFPVPALYKITLPVGAVIRSGVELSSPQIGTAPMGSIVKVIGRAFSEHPTDKCLERLQLAGNGGWISVRLNRPPPHDDVVVDLVGVDSSFDPDSPGMYHLACLREVYLKSNQQQDQHHYNNDEEDQNSSNGELSSVDSDVVSSEEGNNHHHHPSSSSRMTHPRTEYRRSRSDGPRNNNSGSGGRFGPDYHHDSNANNHCLICLVAERNATIVHGETGHVACCLVCARILKARGDKCPVCRLEIDLVIQQFWA